MRASLSLKKKKKKKRGGTSFVDKSCAIGFTYETKRGVHGKRGRGTTNITMLSLQRIPRARVHKHRGQCKKKKKKKQSFWGVSQQHRESRKQQHR